MSTTTTRPAPLAVRLTPFPRARRAATEVGVLYQGAPNAQEARKRQVDAKKVQRGYEAAECLTYAAEVIITADHTGKAGVILGVAVNILIRSRFLAITGRTSGSKPARTLTALRNCPAIDPEEVDQLADVLGSVATTSRAGLSRVITTLRRVLDDLTEEE